VPGLQHGRKQLAFDDDRSKLYFKFEEILKQCNPKYFLLENVKMKQEYKDVISERLGVQPIAINSNLVSAQNRYRLYWTNIEGVGQPEDKGIYLKDILQESVDDKYRVKAGRLKWLQTFGEVKEKDGYVAFNPVKAKCLTVRAEPSWNTTYIVGGLLPGKPWGEVNGELTTSNIRQGNRIFSTVGKAPTITANKTGGSLPPMIVQWPHGTNTGGFRALDGKTPSMTISSWKANNLLLTEGLVRKLTPQECEELQTVPKDYTACVSDSQRYKMLGNGWTVDVIAHIFSYIKG
jgi:site-specific DNA-cytosine methylase